MKIAVLRPGALGDLIMIIQCMPEFKRMGDATLFAHSSLHVVLEEFVRNYDLVTFRPIEEYDKSKFGLVLHPQGYVPAECVPGKRMKKHLLYNFSKEFGVSTSFDKLTLERPPRPAGLCGDPYITIQTKTGWSVYKEWDKWEPLVVMLKEKHPHLGIYQIGGPRDPQVPGITGSFCGMSFMKNLGAQAWSALHVGLDSVLNHTTNIIWRGYGRTKAIILWGSTQADCVGYPHNENVVLNLPCQPCFRQDPTMAANHGGPCDTPPGQTYDKPCHACMAGITVENVYEKIARACSL